MDVSVSAKKSAPSAPLTPSHPADRPSRDELDQAIAARMVPIIAEDGVLRPLLDPRYHLFRLLGDYRSMLRSKIAGVHWDEACRRIHADPSNAEEHKGNLLIWGYRALSAERDAAQHFDEMAKEFATAATASVTLLFTIRQDGRRVAGMPLTVVQRAQAELYQRHAETFAEAFRPRRQLAAKVLREMFESWFQWLGDKGVLRAEPDGKHSRYYTSELSLDDLEKISQFLHAAGELATLILQHGIIAVLRTQRRGAEGRWPVLLDAWLVQQGRSDGPKLGAQKIARLLKAHKLASSDESVDSISRRLKKAAARHPGSVPLTEH